MTDPQVVADGDSWIYIWRDSGVSIGFELLRERSDGLHGELWVSGGNGQDGKASHITWGAFNLSSPTARGRQATILASRPGGQHVKVAEWIQLLEYACTRTAQDFRKGEPVRDLSAIEPVLKLSWLVESLMPDGQPTILYGPGESCKGWLGLAICMAVRLGGEVLPGLRPTRQCNSLYLDWEADYESNVRRQEYIRRGLALNAKIPGIHYRKMYRPLADEISKVRQMIDDTKAGLVVIDSIGMAAAGDIKESDPAQRFMGAVRALRVTPLLLGHVTKEESNRKGTGRRRVIGSIFYELLARSCWEVQAEPGRRPVELTLENRKANIGGRQPTHRFNLHFEDEPDYRIRFERSLFSTSPALAKAGTIAERMIAALDRGSLSTSELADELDVSEAQVRTVAGRLEDLNPPKVVQLTTRAGRGGKGKESVWSLAVFAGGSSA